MLSVLAKRAQYEYTAKRKGKGMLYYDLVTEYRRLLIEEKLTSQKVKLEVREKLHLMFGTHKSKL